MAARVQPDLAQRLFVGPTLIIAGIAIYGGLLLLRWLRPQDWLEALATLLGAQAYGCVAGLFVLLGLRYMLGPTSWIENRIGQSLGRLVVVSMSMTALIVVAVILIVW